MDQQNINFSAWFPSNLELAFKSSSGELTSRNILKFIWPYNSEFGTPAFLASHLSAIIAQSGKYWFFENRELETNLRASNSSK
jgi:hypothetical protein